jgi:hypothetical protein
LNIQERWFKDAVEENDIKILRQNIRTKLSQTDPKEIKRIADILSWYGNIQISYLQKIDLNIVSNMSELKKRYYHKVADYFKTIKKENVYKNLENLYLNTVLLNFFIVDIADRISKKIKEDSIDNNLEFYILLGEIVGGSKDLLSDRENGSLVYEIGTLSSKIQMFIQIGKIDVSKIPEPIYLKYLKLDNALKILSYQGDNLQKDHQKRAVRGIILSIAEEMKSSFIINEFCIE